jgi:phosphoribosylcarboxyaminoimidazole (NCAIR) mutase
MAIDNPGAINAGIYAAEIIATFDPEVQNRLVSYKDELARSVAEKSARVKQQFAAKTS